MKKFLTLLLTFTGAVLLSHASPVHAADYSVTTGTWNSSSTTTAEATNNSYTANGYNYDVNRMVVHSKQPTFVTADWMRNDQTGQNTGVQAYLQNNTPDNLTTTICAMDIVDGKTYQNGCIPQISFENANSGMGPKIQEVHAWPTQMSGTHKMMFTYRGADGQWHPVTGQNTYQM